MCVNTPKLVMITANYHDVTQLLLLTIIVISKNYMILAKKISQLPYTAKHLRGKTFAVFSQPRMFSVESFTRLDIHY